MLQMRPIDYHVTSRVWLSVERFTNAGLTQARVIEIIKSMPDAGSQTLNLRVEEMRVNHNVIVETGLTDSEAIDLMVERIQRRLEEALGRLLDDAKAPDTDGREREL